MTIMVQPMVLWPPALDDQRCRDDLDVLEPSLSHLAPSDDEGTWHKILGSTVKHEQAAKMLSAGSECRDLADGLFFKCGVVEDLMSALITFLLRSVSAASKSMNIVQKVRASEAMDKDRVAETLYK